MHALLIGLFGCFSVSLLAQTQLGLRVGVAHLRPDWDIVVTDIEGNPVENSIYGLNGLSAGVLLPLPLKERLVLQPELSFVQKSLVIPSDAGPRAGVPRTELRFAHLALPVLLKGIFGKHNWQFYWQAGPTLAYTLRGTEVNYTQLGTGTNALRFNNTGPFGFRRLDFGGVVGGGLSYGRGERLRLLLDARYGVGFRNLTTRTTYRNRTFTISTGAVVSL